MATTIKEAITAFGQKFQEVLTSLSSPALTMYVTYAQQACTTDDTTSDASESLTELLMSPELPPYYRMKAHLTLSGTDEQGGAWEDVWAC